jgi:hypothetical protein
MSFQRTWLLSVCALIVAPSSFGADAPGEIDQACRDRFLSEAPNAWKNLKEQLVEFEVELLYRKGTGTKVKLQREWTYCVGKDMTQRLAIRDQGAGAFAINERYLFAVHREKPDGPYQLDTCDLATVGETNALVGTLWVNQNLIASMTNLWWVPFDFVLANDDFVLIRAECDFEERNKEMVRVAYQYRGKQRASPPCIPGSTYWAELSPGDSWAVVRSGVDDVGDEEERVRVNVTNRFQGWFRDGPFPKEVRWELVNSKTGESIQYEAAVYSVPQRISRDRNEFFLPYYGISESSVDILKSHEGWRIALVYIGIVGFALALYLLFRFGRRTATDHS